VEAVAAVAQLVVLVVLMFVWDVIVAQHVAAVITVVDVKAQKLLFAVLVVLVVLAAVGVTVDVGIVLVNVRDVKETLAVKDALTHVNFSVAQVAAEVIVKATILALLVT
jgi:ABC-type polysaccharide/polyol phosphate export permease